jgi:hypothetical protein
MLKQNNDGNLWAVENAVAQQRLEGLEPSQAVVTDLERAARGEISVKDMIANIGKRFANDQILQS